MRATRPTGSSVRSALSVLCLGALASGCALQVEDGVDRVERVARYATAYDHVEDPRANLLDRALADCSEKTVKAERACVRQGIEAAHPAVSTLIALVPNCRSGQVCRYDHTTHDRLGFVRASATEYVKRWRVELDFSRPLADAAKVPLAVIDRDDFDAPPAKPE